MRCLSLLVLIGFVAALPADEAAVRGAVTFYASFDESLQADFGKGGKNLATRSNHPSKPGQFVFENGYPSKIFRVSRERGVSGQALECLDVLPRNGRIFYPAKDNIAYRPGGWGGSVSFWIRSDPDQMLKTKFCDPVQITHRGAHDGAIWTDFNDAKPRHMRMGLYPALKQGEKPLPENDPQAPIIAHKNPQLSASKWKLVVLTWANLDTGKKDARFRWYLDGKLVGEIRDRQAGMAWDMDKVGIYLAINFIGLMDELAIYNRPLEADEVMLLQKSPALLQGLRQRGNK